MLPFDSKGNLKHYYHQGEEVVWEDVKLLDLQLKLVEGVRGRSSAYFIWQGAHKKQYPMCMVDIMELMQRGIITKGETYGVFKGVKRGQSYGIRLA